MRARTAVISLQSQCCYLSRQVLAFSATYTAGLLADLEPLMQRPQKVLLCEDTVSLVGIRQFYKLVGAGGPEGVLPPSAEVAVGAAEAAEGDVALQRALLDKVEKLLQVLSSISFHQVRVEGWWAGLEPFAALDKG
jgi:hypothetical protein